MQLHMLAVVCKNAGKPPIAPRALPPPPPPPFSPPRLLLRSPCMTERA
jgi:hypothetical protein